MDAKPVLFQPERGKILRRDRFGKAAPENGRFQDCMKLALRFLSRVWNICKILGFTMRRTMLGLAFAEQL